jgi:phage shock protein A
MSGYVGILEKASLLLRANVNDLLDRALGANKPAVFDEQINLLRGSLEKITVCLGEAIGRKTTLNREIDELEGQQAGIDSEIDRLLALAEKETDRLRRSQIEALATSRQSAFNTSVQILELKKSQLEQTVEDEAQLQEAKIKLTARIDTLKVQKNQLLALMAERRAAEAQGRALSDTDIRSRFSPEEMIQQEKDALDRAHGIVTARSGSVSEQIDDILGNDVLQQQLAERRARLKGDR